MLNFERMITSPVPLAEVFRNIISADRILDGGCEQIVIVGEFLGKPAFGLMQENIFQPDRLHAPVIGFPAKNAMLRI